MRRSSKGILLQGVLGACVMTCIGLSQATTQAQPAAHDNADGEVQFLRRVLGSTEDVWHDIFAKTGARYEEPKLVLFTKQTHTACGIGKAVTGPFYCTRDRMIYLDLSFFDELKHEYHAPGEFAQAYVVAHEVGHHVQKLLGIDEKVSALQTRSSEKDANRLSVSLELQADCLAGIWAASAEKLLHLALSAEDIEEALRATRALGDDTTQGLEPGTVMLDSFTHGSGEQRARWFKRGLDTGDNRQCNTFEPGAID
jgi:predicted metalloprotease